MKTEPHPVDAHVGQAIKSFRKLRGLNQSEAGRKLGVSFQQLQKYEAGTNRVSASRLYEIAEVLDVSPCDFFPAPAAEVGPAITAEEHRIIAALRSTTPQIRSAVCSLLQSAGGAA